MYSKRDAIVFVVLVIILVVIVAVVTTISVLLSRRQHNLRNGARISESEWQYDDMGGDPIWSIEGRYRSISP